MAQISEKIIQFLKSDTSKKYLELLSNVSLMNGSDFIQQNYDVYGGGDVNYYYSPYFENGKTKALEEPSIKNYLNTLFQLIVDEDLFFDDELYYDYGEDTNYFSIYVRIDFEDKKIIFAGYGVKSDTDYSSYELKIPSEDEGLNQQIEKYLEDGCQEIRVDFSGGGDSGQLDSFECDGDSVDYNASLEDYLYERLQYVQGGWEINEGSQGHFIINCNDRTVNLEFGLNYEKEVPFEHGWEMNLDY